MCQSTSVSDGAAECETNNSSSLKVASVLKDGSISEENPLNRII